MSISYRCRRFAGRSVLFSSLLALSSALCTAQSDDIWRLFDTHLSRYPLFDRFYFEDSLRGYAYYGFSSVAYAMGITTDGGRTWLPGDNGPVPRFTFGDVAVGLNGRITKDGGKTWSSLNPKDADTLLTVTTAYGGYAASARHYAATIIGGQTFRDPFGVIGDYRIAWTNDGGETWQTADSAGLVTDGSSTRYELLPRAGFGPFPGTKPTRWNFIAGYVDTTHLLVVRSTADSVKSPEYYLGTIDLGAGTATWHPLPFWKTISPGSADRVHLISVVSPDLIVAYDLGNPDGHYLWKSRDMGATWTYESGSLPLPDTRFVNDTVWVNGNGYTTDGGKSWTVWPSHRRFYLYGQVTVAYHTTFYPVTMERMLIGEAPLVALSTDGGETWERNAPAFPIQSMIGRDGLIIESRGKHCIRRSTDDGETWVELGTRSGELPDRMIRVSNLSWYDTATSPDRAFGTALIMDETDETHFAAIETTDGGLTWTERGRLDGVGPMQFVRSASGAGRVGFVNGWYGMFKSTDQGITWTRLYDWNNNPPPVIHMFDDLRGLRIDSTLAQTTDGAMTWTQIELPTKIKKSFALPAAIGESDIRVPVLGRNDAVYLVSSSNAGARWNVKALPGAKGMEGPWMWLDADRVYANPPGSLYYSDDGGESFDSIQTFADRGGDPLTQYHELVGRDSRYFYFDLNPIGFGRRLITPEPTTGVTISRDTENGLTLREISSANGTVRLTYTAARSSSLTLEVFDLTGGRVLERKVEANPGTSGMIELHAGDGPSGNYLLRLSSGDASVTRLFRHAR